MEIVKDVAVSLVLCEVIVYESYPKSAEGSWPSYPGGCFCLQGYCFFNTHSGAAAQAESQAICDLTTQNLFSCKVLSPRLSVP